MKASIFLGRREPESAAGHRIGKYEIVTETGASKHARVKMFRALDRDLGRPVTVKTVADANDRRLADQFRRDVSSIAKLRVANVVAIYELGEQEGLPFAAMQYLGDGNLETAIKSGRALTLLQRMLLMEQVAAGAADAQRTGLGYTGLQPSGIALMDEGAATIQDFGVVRLSSGKQTRYGLYAAPEDWEHGFIPDSLSDVFAFGVICYEFLTRRHPFHNSDSAGCDWRAEPASLRQFLPECPEALEGLIARSMAKRRELRYQNFDAIRADLQPILWGLKRSRAAELWADGRRLINTEKLEEAQGVVREALRLNPDDADGQQISSEFLAGIVLQTRYGSWEPVFHLRISCGHLWGEAFLNFHSRKYCTWLHPSSRRRWFQQPHSRSGWKCCSHTTGRHPAFPG